MKRSVSTLTAVVIGMLFFSPSAQSHSEVDVALKMFLAPDSNTFAFDLDRARPRPASPSYQALALKHLPTEGWVTHLNKTKLEKVASLEPILRAHHRETVYLIRVYDDPQAFVGSQFGAVLMISTVALKLLDAAELQASAAHEIGHEYVWEELEIAEWRRDNRRRRELELFCDGVAILTLRRLGINPTCLLTSSEKLMRFNADRTKAPPNPNDHPSLQERKKFAEALMRWAEQGGHPQKISLNLGGVSPGSNDKSRIRTNHLSD